MRRLFLATGLIAVIFGTLSCNANTSASASQGDEEKKDTTRHLSLLFAGDLMQHGPQASAALQGNGKYDFHECFSLVKDEISSADVAIANFEITTAGPPYTGYPRFGTPDSYVEAVKDAGFDILTTSNNHSCDRGKLGIDRTIHVMDSLGMPHLGTYVDQAARDKQYPYLLEKNGFRIVLLTYTYDTNGIPVPKGSVVNLIDKEQMAKDIEKAKSMKPDAIIALMHWGTEYVLQPVKAQTELADWLLAQGVTHIIGGHPHVVEPIEVRTDANGEKHVVAYSLANFVSNQTPKPGQPKDGGIIFRMDLEKDSTVRVKDCRYSLHWVSKPAYGKRKQYRVTPVNMPQEKLTATEKSLMKTFVTTARNMFSKSNKGDVREYQMIVK